ncbi:uracil-xanthine permease family protein [Actinokineospora globicatena]|uniref:uracil-xanthine permease family protein n=1 Tax=Actinokineospora globicatena TaxID=103729 RepID=UPI0020A3F5F3|nr:solute carrier family 23 protein [Actinokineospora globicatena]MCP2304298.1 uracil-xanthine permease [Actinokineospora globicatena]GLW78340.1 nitrate reductase [Actinokineospora globicatena]GLW84996.1 nitrate reductase [Actinokineospora globicatena]
MALWSVHGDGRRVRDGAVVAPDERLSWPLTVGFGVQHVAAMFSATVLVPSVTHFPVTTTLLFSGVGTLLFLFITRNRVPAYLGSSFAFIGPLAAAQHHGMAAQLGGVLVAGLLLVGVGVAVKALGVRLLESIMPPVVTGAVIVLVGLNLAPSATRSFGLQPVIAVITLAVILGCAVVAKGLLSRLSVLVGVLVGWVVAALSGALPPGRLDALADAAWFGPPQFTAPQIQPSVILLVIPVVIVLVAENVGHVKAVAAVTGRDLDGSVGDSLIADGLATVLAGSGGGSGTTTYAENIGVMAATRVYSTAAYGVAGLTAVVLSMSPKFGALVNTIPDGVLGGATILLYGMIALVGVRIWLADRVDFADPVNLTVVAVAVVAGAGDLKISIGDAVFGGIAWGAVAVVCGYPLLRWLATLRRGGGVTGTRPRG